MFSSIFAPLRMLMQVIRMEAYSSRKETSITIPTTKKQVKIEISPRSFRRGFLPVLPFIRWYYADTYRSQRETNFSEYLNTLYSSGDYTAMLEDTPPHFQ